MPKEMTKQKSLPLPDVTVMKKAPVEITGAFNR